MKKKPKTKNELLFGVTDLEAQVTWAHTSLAALRHVAAPRGKECWEVQRLPALTLPSDNYSVGVGAQVFVREPSLPARAPIPKLQHLHIQLPASFKRGGYRANVVG